MIVLKLYGRHLSDENLSWLPSQFQVFDGVSHWKSLRVQIVREVVYFRDVDRVFWVTDIVFLDSNDVGVIRC